MFLLLINTSKKWGGGEVWFLETAKAFMKRGFHVSFVTSGKSPLEKHLYSAGIPVLSIKRSPLWLLLTFFRIKDYFPDEPPVIILVNCGLDLMHACIIKKILSAPSTLILRRGLDKPLKNSFFNRLLYKQADIFIANSKATARTLHHSFPWLTREKIHIIYNPITINPVATISVEQLKQRYNIKNQSYILGIIGRLTHQKGHTILFDALKKVVLYQPDTVLLVIGDGELKEQLYAYIKKIEMEQYCLFLGHQDEITSHYRICDIIVIPSLFEGFCFTAIEAQFLKVPVIASNISSLPEVMLDGKTGLLFKKGDPEDLAKKIIYLLKNTQLRKRMGYAAKQFVIKTFDAQKIYDKIEYIFKTGDR
jgi:glycosyltransferase involved in cell wall biosynthesis